MMKHAMLQKMKSNVVKLSDSQYLFQNKAYVFFFFSKDTIDEMGFTGVKFLSFFMSEPQKPRPYILAINIATEFGHAYSHDCKVAAAV